MVVPQLVGQEEVADSDFEPPENRAASVGDMNDWAKSFVGFNNCWVKVYEHADFGGASLWWAPQRGDLGVLEDEVSSFEAS